VRLRGEQLMLTGPCSADAWYIESHDEDDPMEIVKRLSTNLMGPPCWCIRPPGVEVRAACS